MTKEDESDEAQKSEGSDDTQNDSIANSEYKRWAEEAGHYGITLVRKSEGEKGRQVTPIEREMFYNLNKQAGWSTETIAKRCNWTIEVVRKYIKVIEEREKYKPMAQAQEQPPQIQQQQTPPPPEDIESEIEIPEHSFLPPTFSDEVNYLKKLLVEYNVPKEKIQTIINTVSDIPEYIQSPVSLRSFFTSTKIIDFNLAQIIIKRYFSHTGHERAWEQSQQFQDTYYPHHYGAPGFNQQYPVPQQQRGQPNQYPRGPWGPPPQWYPQQQQQPREKGFTKEELEEEKRKAADKAEELAKAKLEAESLRKEMEAMKQELAQLRNNPPQQQQMVTVERPVFDDNGNVVSVEKVTQPWSPEDPNKDFKDMMRIWLQKQMEDKPPPTPPQSGPSERELQLERDNAQKELLLKMEEQKNTLQREIETIRSDNQLKEALLEVKTAQGSGKMDPKTAVLVAQVEKETKAVDKLADNVSNFTQSLMDTAKFIMDPSAAAYIEAAKQGTTTPAQQPTKEEIDEAKKYMG